MRTALRLVVHPAEVLADQSEEEQLDAGEERDRHDEGREALRARAEEEAFEDRPQRIDRRRRGGDGAEDPGCAKRRDREGEDAVEAQAEELAHRVTRLAPGATVAFDRYPGLPEAHPGTEASQVTVALGEPIQLIDDSP